MAFVDIPVRPHVQQWFTGLYGDEPKGHMRELLGSIINNAQHGYRFSKREIAKPGNAIIRIHVSPKVSELIVNENIIREVGYLLEEHFELALISFVSGYVTAGKMKSYTAIREFYRIYSISEEDYQIDAARAIWRNHFLDPKLKSRHNDLSLK